MARLLKQSTAFTFRIGPFVDDTDFKTAETGLTIAQADIQISKDGGAFAQTSATSPTTTHDTDGWYQCPLTATDTNTLGPLTVQIVVAGALPVWEHFLVVPANVYDSLVDGSDNLQVDAEEISASAAAADNLEANIGNLDAAISALNDPTVAEISDGVWDEDVEAAHGTDATAGLLLRALGAAISNRTNNPTLDALLGVPDEAAHTVESGLDDIETDTGQIGAAGAGLTEAGGTGDHLTAVPWNTAWDAEVESEVTDGLNAYDPPTKAEMDARTLPSGTYFDPATDEVDADVVKISGDATAADRLEAMMDGILIGQVNDLSATTTTFVADGFTEVTNDHFNGRLITFLTGALAGQQTDITDYDGGTQTFTVTALTEAPADDVFFVIH